MTSMRELMRKKLFTKKVLLVLIYISSVSILLNFQLINYNYLLMSFHSQFFVLASILVAGVTSTL